MPAGPDAIDIVGTGGDASGSLNLSTGAALLAAACGLPVVKHGNRSITSRSGSADLIEQLGFAMPLDEQRAAQCFAATGFTFLFAPYFHPAMKALAPIRAALGVRTVFNLLGPLTNPAAPRFQLIGAYDEATAELMAKTLAGMPIERAWVVHGAAGWDEATPIGPFVAFDVAARARSAATISIRGIWVVALPLGGSQGRRCRREPRRLAGGVRRARSRPAPCGADIAVRSRAVHRRPRRLHRVRASSIAGAAIDSGQARGWLERLRRFARGGLERMSGFLGRNGAIERAARGAGGAARIASARSSGGPSKRPPPRRCACRRPASMSSRNSSCALPARVHWATPATTGPARIAAYARGGAAAVSVLTEPSRFDGSLTHLRQAAAVLAPLGVPAMRKDFIVDPYQVLEARAAGAGGVLIILRMLPRARIDELLEAAADQGLFVLLEAFDAADLDLVRDAGSARAERAGRDPF